MCRICERWDSREGQDASAGGSAPAPLASHGAELLSPTSPDAHLLHHHQQDDTAATFRWSTPEVDGQERAGPQQSPNAQGADGQTRETAISLGYITRVSAFRARSGRVNREGSIFYRFKLSAPRRLRIELRNLSVDADLYLLNAAGTQIAVSDLDGTLVDSILHDLDPGAYFIRVSAYANRAVDFQLRYRTEAIARTPETAISLGDLTNVTSFRTRRGTLLNPTFFNVNPVFFRFTLSAARTVRVELRDLAGNRPSGEEALRLHDSFGDVRNSFKYYPGSDRLAEDNTMVQWLTAGTYYVSVDAFGGRTSEFQVRYRTEPARGARGSSLGTAWYLGDLTSATTYRVRSGTADRDGVYRRFTVAKWRVVRFELRNLSSSGRPARVRLLDLYGRHIDYSLEYRDGKVPLLRDLRPGTYFVFVDNNTTAASPVRYQLRYRREPTPPRGASHATAWYIGNLTRAGGKFRNKYATVHQGNRYGERDTDYRRFTLTETRTMRIELRRISFTARDGFFAGIHLGVEDAHGRSVEDDLPFSGTRGHMTTYQSRLGPGTYYIWVRGGHLLGESETIRYHLRYRTLPESGASGQSLWRDDTVSAGSASRLDERRNLVSAGGMLSA